MILGAWVRKDQVTGRQKRQEQKVPDYKEQSRRSEAGEAGGAGDGLSVTSFPSSLGSGKRLLRPMSESESRPGGKTDSIKTSRGRRAGQGESSNRQLEERPQ